MSSEHIICPSCGVKNLSSNTFCLNCGSSFTKIIDTSLLESDEKVSPQKVSKQAQSSSFSRQSYVFFTVGISTILMLSAFGWDSLNKGIEGFALSGAAGSGSQPNSSPTQNPAINSRSISSAPVMSLDPALVEKLKTLQEELGKATSPEKKSSIALALSDEYIRLKRYDLAGKYSEIALMSTQAPSIELSIRTANLYDDAELDSLAAIYYQKSLAIDPLKTDVRVDYAICLLSIGNFEGGKTEMERAVRDNPSHQKANLNVGIIYLQTNEIAKARGYWEKALKINPQNDAGTRAKELLDTYR